MEAQDKPGVVKGHKPLEPRRSTGDEIANAIDLGWRVAALYGLNPRTMKAPSETSEDMLLNRRSLSPADRLELEIKAIAGVAKRLAIPLDRAEEARLVTVARAAGDSEKGEKAFRDELEVMHVAFDKALWTADESHGKAYELGNFVSDTWNRVARPRVKPDSRAELVEVFSPVRVERMKLLIDDLQARVDPVAAHAVLSHLDAWRDRLLAGPGDVPGEELAADALVHKLEPVERQTIIWRQLLTGDKEPEAYIGHTRRAEVRDELTKQLWSRYRRWIWLLPVAAAIGLFLGYEYTHNRDLAKTLAGGIFALTGALGITRATMISTVKRGVQSWGDLMWNRALAAVICRETSLLHQLFPDDQKPRGLARLRRG